MDKLTEIIDRGKPADIFYLDFAKAFDKVPRARLLQKMRTKGISGQVQYYPGWRTGSLAGHKQLQWVVRYQVAAR